ncbi:hypothetical protein F0562_032718 [Nyssa sinensis]|uniref:DYW domain-containing protein n=1 Tax=Nyssa sinensis TaxID=561372 RepID=A0A5J5ANJ0_9ASTE|nr:hypothetical protein F0562_032718 [Nyssa sinensis]
MGKTLELNFRRTQLRKVGVIPMAITGKVPRNEFQQNPVGQNWNSSTGYYRESSRSRNEFQQGPIGQSGNVKGYYGKNLGELQLKQSEYNAERVRTLQKSVNGLYGENTNVQNASGSKGQAEVQQNTNILYQQRVSESQGAENGHFGETTGQFQQSPNKYQVTITRTTLEYTNKALGGYHGENGRSTDGYLRGNVESYQQNPSGNYNANIGKYQNSSESQNGMAVPHVSSNSEPAGESVEATKSGQYIGTIEELDDFCNEGKLKEAVEVLQLLEKLQIPVDVPLYLKLMKACGDAKALQEAKSVHEHLMRSVSPLQVSTYNKILEMYAKCGSMDDAYMVFHKMQQRNLTSWDTMISWLANNGLGEDAIELFTQFKEAGLKPDGQMFIGVFSACRILVDMLGSAGYLDEALEFIEKMPMEPSVDVWETLMNLCRVYGNMELGDRCAELVELLDSSRLNEQSKAGLIPVKASDLAKEKEKKKLAGQNLLEVRSRVHEYRAGDTSHPDSDKIYALLRGMKEQMKEAGYVPETKFVLHDIDQEGKEDALLAHSERLAVAQGLISSPARSTMRIIKNLRMGCVLAVIIGEEGQFRDLSVGVDGGRFLKLVNAVRTKDA